MSWLQEHAAQLIGLLGLIALALPAIKADAFARREALIKQAARHEGTDEWLKKLRELRERNPPPSWTPLNTLLLYGGYGLLTLSFLIPLLG